MKRAAAAATIGAVVTAIAVAGTTWAYAGWVVQSNTLTVTGSIAGIPRGATPSVAIHNDQAVVSWNAQEIARGVKMDRYVVTAHSQGRPAKPDVIRQVDASGGGDESTAFTAGDVEGGAIWKWTVIPCFGSWMGAESELSAAIEVPASPARVIRVPAPRKAAPQTSATTASAAAKPLPPAASPDEPTDITTTSPTSPDKDVDPVPPAPSPAEAEPPTKKPDPFASGSASADIPE